MGSVAGHELCRCAGNLGPRFRPSFRRLLHFIRLLQEQLLTCLA